MPLLRLVFAFNVALNWLLMLVPSRVTASVPLVMLNVTLATWKSLTVALKMYGKVMFHSSLGVIIAVTLGGSGSRTMVMFWVVLRLSAKSLAMTVRLYVPGLMTVVLPVALKTNALLKLVALNVRAAVPLGIMMVTLGLIWSMVIVKFSVRLTLLTKSRAIIVTL